LEIKGLSLKDIDPRLKLYFGNPIIKEGILFVLLHWDLPNHEALSGVLGTAGQPWMNRGALR
jgi:hypothetical protein